VRLLLVAWLLTTTQLLACTLVADFDLARAVENSDALCSDGIDNDGNGLTDCQDWACLSRPVCCNMPVVVLQDDFEGPTCSAQSCVSPDRTCAPDPALWTPWGAPLPVLCQGGLSPNKAQQCYAVGVLSTLAVLLHPGLAVAAHLDGQPELVGRLELGLTLKDQVSGADNACSLIDGPQPVISIRQVGAQGGYLLQAFFDGTMVGATGLQTADVRHEASIRIDTDRLVQYEIDGVPFATSPKDQPLPAVALTAHIELSGVGIAARFADVRVIDGTQCDSPGSWQAATPFLALGPGTDFNAWDGHSVYDPVVASTVNGDLVLYYTGCMLNRAGTGCAPQLGVGRAVSLGGQPFVRDAAPRSSPTVFQDLKLTLLSGTALDSVDDPVTGYLTKVWGAADWSVHLITDSSGDTMSVDHDVVKQNRLERAPMGSWDDETICCASVLPRGAQQYLFYAAQHTGDPTWRIGLATSQDGGTTFTRVGDAPVLGEGKREEFDGRGALDPMVVFDDKRQLYRMWYHAEALFGVTSIGYAASTDGIHWHKFPGNPVVDEHGSGLGSLGGPAVLVEEGQMRMWLHGADPQHTGSSIYQLVNGGQPPND
jgi:hypothetical protein